MSLLRRKRRSRTAAWRAPGAAARPAPPEARGRVSGVVYGGRVSGQAMAALVLGWLRDHGQYTSVIVGLALVLGVLIASAFNVRRVRRTALVPASA